MTVGKSEKRWKKVALARGGGLRRPLLPRAAEPRGVGGGGAEDAGDESAAAR